MATKTEAYVDTSALIAFLDRSDSYHPLFRRMFSNPPRLVTSALVVLVRPILDVATVCDYTSEVRFDPTSTV
jgi:predicted nucleic acid-binding protein